MLIESVEVKETKQVSYLNLRGPDFTRYIISPPYTY